MPYIKKRPQKYEQPERNRTIYDLVESKSMSLTAIGKLYPVNGKALSKQRVDVIHQTIKRSLTTE